MLICVRRTLGLVCGGKLSPCKLIAISVISIFRYFAGRVSDHGGCDCGAVLDLQRGNLDRQYVTVVPRMHVSSKRLVTIDTITQAWVPPPVAPDERAGHGLVP